MAGFNPLSRLKVNSAFESQPSPAGTMACRGLSALKKNYSISIQPVQSPTRTCMGPGARPAGTTATTFSLFFFLLK